MATWFPYAKANKTPISRSGFDVFRWHCCCCCYYWRWRRRRWWCLLFICYMYFLRYMHMYLISLGIDTQTLHSTNWKEDELSQKKINHFIAKVRKLRGGVPSTHARTNQIQNSTFGSKKQTHTHAACALCAANTKGDGGDTMNNFINDISHPFSFWIQWANLCHSFTFGWICIERQNIRNELSGSGETKMRKWLEKNGT